MEGQIWTVIVLLDLIFEYLCVAATFVCMWNSLLRPLKIFLLSMRPALINRFLHDVFFEQSYNRDLFIFLYILLIIVSAMTSLKKHNDKSAFSGKSILYLNRHQTEEWKGWMQASFCVVFPFTYSCFILEWHKSGLHGFFWQYFLCGVFFSSNLVH